MKYLALLLIFGFGISGFGQTIKSLGYNTTNGQVVAATAELKFTNETRFGDLRLNNANGVIFIPDLDGAKDIFYFDNDAVDVPRARANLGLGWSALTNSNSGIGLVSVNSNGTVVSPANFWSNAPISSVIDLSTTNATGVLPIVKGGTGGTNSDTALTNLGIFPAFAAVVVGGSNVTGGNTVVGSGATADDGSGLGGVAIGRSVVVSNSAIGVGYAAVARDISGGTGIGGVAVGYQATNISSGGASIGYRAQATNGGAVGKEATAFNGFAGGDQAKANAVNAVQLGTGTLTNSNSIQFLNAGAVDTNEWNALANASTLGRFTLTNSSAESLRNEIGLGTTNTVTFRRVVVDPQASGALGIQYGANDSGLYNGANYNQLSLRVGGINALTAETNGVTFASPAAVRTNLGLGWPALTNTSNAGFRTAIGVAPAPIFKVLTNDFNITNQTNMTVVDGLTITTEAGKNYICELLPILSANSGNTVMQIVGSNATVYGNWLGQNVAVISTNSLTNEFSVAITSARAFFQKFHVITGTNSGSISFQFRNATNNNTNTIGAGSYMMAQEILVTP